MEKNKLKGATIAGLICWILGCILIFISPWLFFIYSPLLLASFILGIISIAQKNVFIGIIVLISSILAIPSCLITRYTIIETYRKTKLMNENRSARSIKMRTEKTIDKLQLNKKTEDINVSILVDERIKKEYDSICEEINRLKNKSDNIVISDPKYYWEGEIINQPVIDFNVKNLTNKTISKLFFHGILQTPGRKIPWVDDNFNYKIRGGLEPNELKHLKLSAGFIGDWHNRDLESREDLELIIEVIKAYDENDNEIPLSIFTIDDKKQCLELLKKKTEYESILKKNNF